MIKRRIVQVRTHHDYLEFVRYEDGTMNVYRRTKEQVDSELYAHESEDERYGGWAVNAQEANKLLDLFKASAF